MFLKTSVSWDAKPFTVSTRLGIRSLRRCRATSTVLQEAVTASRRVTRSLRTSTNLLQAPIPTRSRTATTIRAIFTGVLLIFRFGSFLYLVHSVDDLRDF